MPGIELAYSPASLELAQTGFKQGKRRPVWVAAGIGEAAEVEVRLSTPVRTGIPEHLRQTYIPFLFWFSVLNSTENTGTFTADSRRP